MAHRPAGSARPLVALALAAALLPFSLLAAVRERLDALLAESPRWTGGSSGSRPRSSIGWSSPRATGLA